MVIIVVFNTIHWISERIYPQFRKTPGDHEEGNNSSTGAEPVLLRNSSSRDLLCFDLTEDPADPPEVYIGACQDAEIFIKERGDEHVPAGDLDGHLDK